MKNIIKFRWFIVTLWVFAAVALFMFGPNLQQLVAEKGQITVPEGNESIQASKLLEKFDEENVDVEDAILVFHHEDELSKEDKDAVAEAIEILEENQEKLGISDILNFTESEEIEEIAVSEDNKTIITPFKLSLEDQSVEEARQAIYEAIDHIDVDHHLTGEVFISEDILINSQEGLKKTIYITVVLILIILFVVFKSFVAPIIPLLTIGISYVVAQSIVAILADTVNFPLSTFTQTFMVAIMFGIGTDYCILIISRFKEEINRHESVKDAIVTTYKASGKTILFAGLAVLIGFSTIGLSKFTLYQSAVAVAVGIAVTLVALVTIVPFFLVLFGRKLFWPFDKNVEHKESKIWNLAGTFAWRRPVFALLIVAIITVPTILTYKGDVSYDSLDELGDDFGSVIAFNWVTDSFGPGNIMPTTVVMETDKPVTSVEDYQAIEKISQDLAKVDGVDSVRSATRPAGEIIEDFLMESQANLLADGLGEGADGIRQIESGLREASTELNEQSPQLDEAKDGVGQLMAGTDELNAGIGQIQSALSEIENGIMSGSSGAGEIRAGLEEIKKNLDRTIAGNKQLLNGYKQIADGLASFGSIDSMSMDELQQLKGVLDQLEASVNGMNQIATMRDPSLSKDSNYQQAYQGSIQMIQGLKGAFAEIETQLSKLAEAGEQVQTQVVQPLRELNKNYEQIVSGQEQISAGLKQLIDGVSELESGLAQAADGQNQVVQQFPTIRDGLSQMYGGQSELRAAFAEIQSGLEELSAGLGEGSDGLAQIDEGLSTVQEYLGDFSVDIGDPVVIIPEEALEDEDFQEGAGVYISDDNKIVKFDIVLDYNPYSQEAIQLMKDIKETANNAIEDTPFEDSNVKVGGVTSVNNDLKNVSEEDYTRTATLMLIGIFIILVILLRSFVMPIYLIGSLLVTYYTSIGLTELIFVKLLDYDGLTWAIPFFSFVMLIALGIDYSIFLMGRFNEANDGFIKHQLLYAMKNMGTVIISATIILGGTFGAMLPSGVLSLLQIATVVIIGLILYALVMLPLFTPIMVRFFGKYNWWPFKATMEMED